MTDSMVSSSVWHEGRNGHGHFSITISRQLDRDRDGAPTCTRPRADQRMQSGVLVLLSRSDEARPLIARAGQGGDEELTGAFGESRHRREWHASGLCGVCKLFAL